MTLTKKEGEQERIEALYGVFISHNPEGTWEQFLERLDVVDEIEDKAIHDLRHGNPIVKFLKGR